VLRIDLDPAPLRIEQLWAIALTTLLAQQREEGVVHRFDDRTDTAAGEIREEELRRLLAKFALDREPVVRRSERRDLYVRLAQGLAAREEAFVDEAHPRLLRLRAPDRPVSIEDTVRGTVTLSPEAIGEIVLLDADGIPSAEFASAVDDMLDAVTLAVVPDRSPTAAARQEHIRRRLDYDAPVTWLHLPPLKSDEGMTKVLALLEAGYLPDAILNALLSLGVRPPEAFFTLPEATAWYTPRTLSPEPVRLDTAHLRTLNRAHLQRMDDKALSSLYGFADAAIGRLVKLYLDEAATLEELDARIRPIFAPKPCEGKSAGAMRRLADAIADMPMLRTWHEAAAWLRERTALEGEALERPLRRLLTGSESGPPLAAIYPHIQSYITEVARCPH